MSDDNGPASARVGVRPLKGFERGLVTLVGLWGLTLGALATFKTNNQAGTAALLGLGAVAGLIALVGRLPLRWVIGGNTFDMSEEVARLTVDAVISELGPDETADLADRLADVDRSQLSPMTGMMQDVVRFEHRAIVMIKKVVADHPTWGYEPVSASNDRGVDGFLVADGRLIPVVYKWLRESASAGPALQTLQRYSGVAYSDLIVVFAGSPVTTLNFQKRVQMFRQPRVHPVFVDDTEFKSSLEIAVAVAGDPVS